MAGRTKLTSKDRQSTQALVLWNLHAAGLGLREPFGRGKEAVLAAIHHLGYVQIDTISVVARAQHHVLWSRVPGYRREWLDELQKERKILEYWAHAAAYLPMSDYRYTLPTKKYFRDHQDSWQKSDAKTKKQVLKIIRAEGPKMARDFASDRKRKAAGWWDWKPAKVALERLYFEGELCCSHRVGFQKVYDLTERVIPSGLNTSYPSDEEYADYLIDGALRLHGHATTSQMGYLRKGLAGMIKGRVHQRTANLDLISLPIKNSTYFIERKTITIAFKKPKPHIHLLSPFDPFLIQRKRTQELFNFDYQLECYLPAARRRYGYFVLPILHGAKFIGRLDAKADRKTGQFIVKELHFENPDRKRQPLKLLEHEISRYARFCGCDGIAGTFP